MRIAASDRAGAENEGETEGLRIVGAIGDDETSPDDLRPVVARGDVAVAVVDDHQLVSQLLVGVLRSAGFRAVSAYRSDRSELLDDLLGTRPDVVLLDYYLEDGTSTDLIGPMVDVGIAVVMLSAIDDVVTMAECVDAGAIGYLNKGVSPEDLVRAIEAALTGDDLLGEDARIELTAALRRAQSRLQADLAPFARLTVREQQTLEAICDGRSAAQMAEAWEVSVATVRSHIRSVLVKLDAKSQLEAAAMARRIGWPEVLRSLETG